MPPQKGIDRLRGLCGQRQGPAERHVAARVKWIKRDGSPSQLHCLVLKLRAAADAGKNNMSRIVDVSETGVQRRMFRSGVNALQEQPLCLQVGIRLPDAQEMLAVQPFFNCALAVRILDFQPLHLVLGKIDVQRAANAPDNRLLRVGEVAGRRRDTARPHCLCTRSIKQAE